MHEWPETVTKEFTVVQSCQQNTLLLQGVPPHRAAPPIIGAAVTIGAALRFGSSSYRCYQVAETSTVLGKDVFHEKKANKQ